RVSDPEIRWAGAANPDLAIAEGLVVERDALSQASAIRSRSLAHRTDSGAYLDLTLAFVRKLIAVAPFIRAVSIAGSLASGGFRASRQRAGLRSGRDQGDRRGEPETP